MTPISLIPEKVEVISFFSCCVLHNFLRSRNEACAIYMPSGYVDTENPITHVLKTGNWHQGRNSTGLAPLNRQSGNMHTKTAKENRDRLCKYFCSKEGKYLGSGLLLNTEFISKKFVICIFLCLDMRGTNLTYFRFKLRNSLDVTYSQI